MWIWIYAHTMHHVYYNTWSTYLFVCVWIMSIVVRRKRKTPKRTTARNRIQAQRTVIVAERSERFLYVSLKTRCARSNELTEYYSLLSVSISFPSLELLWVCSLSKIFIVYGVLIPFHSLACQLIYSHPFAHRLVPNLFYTAHEQGSMLWVLFVQSQLCFTFVSAFGLSSLPDKMRKRTATSAGLRQKCVLERRHVWFVAHLTSSKIYMYLLLYYI